MGDIEGHSLTTTSWSLTDSHDHWELGAIYLDPLAPERAYMATNGRGWAHVEDLDQAVDWLLENPRQRPLRIVDGRKWQEDPRVFEEALTAMRAERQGPHDPQGSLPHHSP